MRVRTYVNQQKRTCVVVLDECEGDVHNKIRKVFKTINDCDFQFLGANSFLDDEPFVGKARCCPEDEWDEQFGVNLARERALTKYRRAYARIYAYHIAKLEKIADELKKYK